MNFGVKLVENVAMNSWTRDSKIAVIGVMVGIVAVLVAIIAIPQINQALERTFRNFAQLPSEAKAAIDKEIQDHLGPGAFGGYDEDDLNYSIEAIQQTSGRPNFDRGYDEIWCVFVRGVTFTHSLSGEVWEDQYVIVKRIDSVWSADFQPRYAGQETFRIHGCSIG